MSELEQLLNEIPVRIQEKKRYKCPCGNTCYKTVEYNLKVEVSRSYNLNGIGRNNYRVYYYGGMGEKVIGELSTHRTLLEAVKNLKEGYLDIKELTNENNK